MLATYTCSLKAYMSDIKMNHNALIRYLINMPWEGSKYRGLLLLELSVKTKETPNIIILSWGYLKKTPHSNSGDISTLFMSGFQGGISTLFVSGFLFSQILSSRDDDTPTGKVFFVLYFVKLHVCKKRIICRSVKLSSFCQPVEID